MLSSHDEFIGQLQALVGAENVISQAPELDPFLSEWRGRWRSESIAAALPSTSQEVSECVKLCALHQISIVPQGGNTGLCGGAVSHRGQLILSTKRLTKIRETNVDNFSITVEAGCILEQLQTVASQVDRLFPLSLGAQGSCHIGGNLATNAGGTNVLRYGNARDLCLGLEVVLANGDILSDLTSLRKDNTGYDLKNLFIGSEGTLGIITAAALKLFPAPKSACTALIAFSDIKHVNTFFSALRKTSGDQISTFELIPDIAVSLTEKHFTEFHSPFKQPFPWYVLAVLQSHAEQTEVEEQMRLTLSNALNESIVVDAVVAQNTSQANKLIQLRELIVETQRREGASIKHDVSVPISSISAFIEAAQTLVKQSIPGARPYPFGHFGDGNIHYNICQPIGSDSQEFLQRREELSSALYRLVNQLSGSFSAEHGIGLVKIKEMEQYKDSVSLSTMQSIKRALDPENLFNPGKVLPNA